MTNEQAKKMLKAKLECLKRETSGTDFDCNNSNCDECSLSYEQGNMGEQKEALVVSIKALEQQPCEDTISRQAAIDVLDKRFDSIPMEQTTEILLLRKDLRNLPSAQPERIKGHWVNGRCDKCNGHAPFWCMASTYYASNFCPNCGADMRGEQDE